ncbi:hypothetical protein OQA88_4948 [Cercophora sp. LCS_1]
MTPTPKETPNPPTPGTPKRTSAAKNGAAPTTPANRRGAAQVGATPKSAPAAAGQGSRKKPEPSLLADFLLGRPAPARIAAQRSASKQRRKSVALDAAGVREELRQEMRAAAVRRLQQPGGVRDRVKAWQKANVSAMKAQGGGVPDAEDVASEPTEFAAHIDDKSVTEEDRVRIKFRQRSKRKKPRPEKAESEGAQEDGDVEEQQGSKSEADKPNVVNSEPRGPQPKEKPKKRIVSDDNWMKRDKGKGKANAPKPKAEGNPTPIPKDFLQKTAQNPSVQNKIKDWAKRVELPENPEPAKGSPVKLPREGPRVKRYHHTHSGEVVTVEEDASSVATPKPEPKSKPAPPFDDGIRVRPVKPKKAKAETDDGIRVKPVRKRESFDDGIRVRPIESSTSLPDDGIRVAPIETRSHDDGIRTRPLQRASVDGLVRSARSPSPASSASSFSSQRTSVRRSVKAPSIARSHSPGDVIEVVEDWETEVATPTRRKGSSQRRGRKSRSPMPRKNSAGTPTQRPRAAPSEDPSAFSQVDGSVDGSERPPTVGGNKSLAEIPFGYSAFSVLELPLRGNERNSVKKPKAQRSPSFKTVPNVLKKVMSGAKEIIHEAVDPPKPVVNRPPNIETWLSNTVDPFVEGPERPKDSEERPKGVQGSSTPPVRQRESSQEPLKRSVSRGPQKETPSTPQNRSASQSRQKGMAQEIPQRSVSQSRRTEPGSSLPAQHVAEDQENTDPKRDDSDATPRKAKTPTTPSTGLKRRRATRSTSSPVKSTGKKPFRETLKEAFRGESGGHKLPPMVYPSCETDYDSVSDAEDDEWETREVRRRSTGSSKRSPSPDPSSTLDSGQSSVFTDPQPARRRPPTKGYHELSTIVSEHSNSVLSDTISDVSHTTITQPTAFTKSTDVSRHKSNRSSLKRRLTKHSDLVSVLSLPDSGHLVPPSRSKSVKSSRSLHRKPSKADRSKIDDLLDEFADDEHFYGRELKTLVDGVVPVLLKDVVRHDSRIAVSRRESAMSKAVVGMGVCLERLRNLHRSVPLSDIRYLLTWLESVSDVYDEYLDVWRLGFQDLIVNLAPVSGLLDDEDSLVNALPRNADGDVLGEHGERVDVAYLLKRPLIRIKWMTKFLKAAVMAMDTREADDVLARYEALQEKARRRHREEVARITDEDANDTDTTRARDMRNLAPLDGVAIDQSRQVAAKDSFELDLDHSSGQRLECQVELIHRDKPNVPADRGDILIREIGRNGSQSWLLFPPIPKERISARRGDETHALLIMIRGTHNHREWFEIIKLSTDCDEQIDDWLSIMGSNPMPPLTRPKPTVNTLPSTPPRADAVDVPVGEKRLSQSVASSPAATKPKTPSRYHVIQKPNSASSPILSPVDSRSPSSDRTATQEDYSPLVSPSHPPAAQSPSAHAREDVDGELANKPSRAPPNSTPFREDGAPPPPIHRTLTTKNSSPPVDLGPPARVKRRGSSPLKHEYHPSDVSSDSSASSASSVSSVSDDESASSESSSDEFDDEEVPETIPGYSIRKPEAASAESVVSESSITPSHSASQVGVRNQHDGPLEPPSQKFIASVSYWSAKKGMWKDVSSEPSCVSVYPGSMEVHRLNGSRANHAVSPLQSSGTSEIDNRDKDAGGVVPLLGLILTPVVMIRRSTALDLEVRSHASPASRLKTDSAMFRFRAASQNEAKDLYEAVHRSRLNNARYIQLSEEARVRSFGQQQSVPVDASVDGDSSSRRKSFFGRKNSYRASTRAPSLSQHSTGSTTISATSFLRRLTGGYNTSFNIDESTVNKQSRPGSLAGGASGSLDSSSGSSAGGGSSSTPPRSLSISLSGSGGSQSRWSTGLAKPFSPDHPLEIRCHLNVQNNRWADKGDCVLHISRPPPGVRQELRLNHGMEKRIIVTHATKKAAENPVILLDAVLGSKCFSMLGTKGIMCSVWENLRDEDGNVGVAPATGALAGKVTKWCFQCKSVQQADWIMHLVTSEVPMAGLINSYP